jgi:hypothetical protein
MISHTSSISSSLGNSKNLFKEKDYDLIHYFDDQSDNEIQQEKHKNKNINKKTSIFKENDIYKEVNLYSSSDDSDEQSKEDNFFIDDESVYESNEKVIEISPDGNFGKVNKNLIIFKNIL